MESPTGRQQNKKPNGAGARALQFLSMYSLMMTEHDRVRAMSTRVSREEYKKIIAKKNKTGSQKAKKRKRKKNKKRRK